MIIMRPMRLKRFWKDLSVSKKLYTVVGILAVLIASELLTLLFAMNILSAVRAFVGGEALWSKAQKDAIHNLERYVITNNSHFYTQFLESMKIPMGDHVARKEMAKHDMNFQVVKEGFIAGGNHPDDIVPMVNLMRRFYKIDYLERAIGAWQDGDKLIHELLVLGEEINTEVKRGKRLRDEMKIAANLDKVYDLNRKLTIVETNFSSTLGEASRWLEGTLAFFLVLLVIIVEGTGLTLTFVFSRRLTRELKELNTVAQNVGAGNFDVKAPLHSNDEVGQLAQSLNQMIVNIKQLISDRQNAEHASQVKNLFLANMSHEIRTPLNAILGFSDLLRDPELNAEDKKYYLDIIKRTGNNLATIINDILDLSKVEAEQLETENEVFSLTQMLSDLEVLVRIRSEEKGISFDIKSEGEIAEYIASDPIRLRQILLNIVGNAIKFTDRGGVSITYSVRSGYLFFVIKDSGKGITQEQYDNLFKPFSQGDSSVRKKFGGTGLGLILSKKLAQLLGGDVGLLESFPGVGSTFFVRISYVPVYGKNIKLSDWQSDVAAEKLDTSVLKGKTALVVEDTRDNQILINLYLGKLGMKVECADNGDEGVKKALTGDYDIILMDMQMPVKDGYEATRELRAAGLSTPIIALTGYAMKGDREKCLKAGCVDYISKPIDKFHLLGTLTKHIKYKSLAGNINNNQF